MGAGIGVPPMGGSSSGGGFRDVRFTAATGAEETSGIAAVATMLVLASSGSCPSREGNSSSGTPGECYDVRTDPRHVRNRDPFHAYSSPIPFTDI